MNGYAFITKTARLSIKELLWATLSFFGIHHLFRYRNRKKILILMYHGVVETDFNLFCWWLLSFKKFKWQMGYLKKHYHVVPLETVINALAENKPLPDNAAVITFDDGYENNCSIACPLLAKENLPCTIFLTTGSVGTGDLLWPDQLCLAFLGSRNDMLDLTDLNLGAYHLTSKSSREHSFYSLIDILKEMPIAEKNHTLEIIKSRLGNLTISSEEQKAFRLLSWDHVNEAHHSGMVSFGAHSHNHEILTRFSNDVMQEEITHSCSTIREKLKIKNVAFAYPNGRKADFNETSINILRHEKALCGLSTVSGLNDYNADIFALKRIGIGADITKSRFKISCAGFDVWLKSLSYELLAGIL